MKREKSCNFNIDNREYERHHIRPRSLGGEYEDNMVYLTPREHFIAHYLLMKITNTNEMKKAFNLMSNGVGITGYSSRKYEKQKKFYKNKQTKEEKLKTLYLVVCKYFNKIFKTEKQLKNITNIFYILICLYSLQEKSVIKITGLEEYKILLFNPKKCIKKYTL
jgi:hypothetical protein